MLVDTNFWIFQKFFKVGATFSYRGNIFSNKSFIRLVETDFLSSGNSVFWSELFFCLWKPLWECGENSFQRKGIILLVDKWSSG